MGRSKAPSLPIKALSFCRPTELRGWQRNWIHRGALRSANPVTCFPPGKVVAPATKGGMHFLARRAVVWFSDGRKPGCPVFAAKGGIKNAPERAPTSPAGTVSQPIGKPFNGQAKGLLWLTWRSYAGPPQYFIPPEGGALNPSGRRQPVPDRTLAAQGRKARRRPQPSSP